MRRSGFNALLVAGVVTACAAHADVTVESKLSVTGAGLLSMGNMHGTSTTVIANDRARTDSDIQMESGLMRTLARNVGQTSQITRLDQEKIYMLNNKKQTYSEKTFAEMRDEMNKAREQMQKAQGKQQASVSGVDDSDCEWQDAKANVKRTGEKATVGGFPAEHVLITATQACKLKKSDQVCEFGIAMDEWVSSNTTGVSEMQTYYRAYSEKMGLTTSGSADFAERAQSAFGQYKDLWSQLATKMSDLKGYPVKSSISLGVGGPQCQKAESGNKEAPPSVGNLLGGMFGKKKEADAPPPAPAQLPGGLTAIMTVSNEIVSIKQNKADAAAFEVPAGYKPGK
jgi:hypothetical protein